MEKREGLRKGKKGQMWQTLVPWIIGLVVLALVIILYLALSGKASGMAEYLKNLWRFGK